MNIAAFISGPVIDIFNYGRDVKPLQYNKFFATNISGNRYVILSTTLTYVVSFVVTLKYLREVKVNDDNDNDNDNSISDSSQSNTYSKDIEMTVSPMVNNDNNTNENNEHTSPIHDDSRTASSTEEFNFYQLIIELCSSKTLARYAVFTLLLVNLKSVFRHLDATFPTYLLRTYGENFPKGLMYSINPLIIVFLTPLVGAFLQQYKHFDMIKYGGFVKAAAPFFLGIHHIHIMVSHFMIIIIII